MRIPPLTVFYRLLMVTRGVRDVFFNCVVTGRESMLLEIIPYPGYPKETHWVIKTKTGE